MDGLMDGWIVGLVDGLLDMWVGGWDVDGLMYR